ncbi:MAG TPA: AMP-binding protein [Rhodocyclaceae bacterium]|nr:AMP-binding protein [Rhodocyclaceae bacterium]
MLPLTSHPIDGIIAHGSDGPISVARFLADVARVSALLPEGGHVLNLCQDRYRFLVGLSAALVVGKQGLMPADYTPETIARIKALAPDACCFHDGQGDTVDLPQVRFPETPAEELSAPPVMPYIPADRVMAILFTSGSTGVPQPHVRRWGSLVVSAQGEAQQLGLVPGQTIVGTVPSQHSYGMESVIMLTLHGGCTCWTGRPFYPADIAAALSAVPAPRLLVTTPFHLRTLLDADVDCPQVEQQLSATAPLSENLAREAEQRLGGPLFEIYGCTETGQVATRRTCAGPAWQLLPGVQLDYEGDDAHAHGGHVLIRHRLADRLEPTPDGGFVLHGRIGDLLNIAGKRSSIGYLNHQLLGVEGVVDGCFFMPDDQEADGITRLWVFVVAPTLTARQIQDELRKRVDPVFLPRPLVFVDSLPRNANGKTLRGEMMGLVERHLAAQKSGGGA